jgi:hypothetical protein
VVTYVRTAGSKKLDDGRWSHTFTQSIITEFQQCPEKARANYFRETESEDTDSTSLGRAVHAGIEVALYSQRDSHMLKYEEAREAAHHELDTIGEWKYTKLSRDNVYGYTGFLLFQWYENVYGTFEPAKIEHSFRHLLYGGKHREVWLNGTIDCVDQSYVPWDWKTSSRPYEPWEKQRWAVQPTVYTWAVQKEWNGDMPEHGMDPAKFRYCVLQHDGTVQQIDVTRDHTHVAWLAEQCSQIAWMIEHEIKPWPLIDSGWHCSPKWCPKFSDCKGKFIDERWTQ